jgi:chromosome segregation ATPase
MMLLIGEMLGCLIVAAGIGAVVGWLLRHLSVQSLNQHVYDLTTALQQKEQTLHQIQLELKAKSSTLQIYEGKITASEAVVRAAQDDLAARTEQLDTVQRELAAAAQRVSTLESEHGASLQRFQESDATIAAFELEARQANAARTAAQQALGLREEQLLELQGRVKLMDDTFSEVERLKAQITDMEPAQGRVHWLEVQLSEKEVQHRATLHELEEQRATLTKRTAETESLQQQLQKQDERVREWETRYQKALKQHDSDSTQMEKQRAAIQELRSTVGEHERSLAEKESQLAAAQRQLDELRALRTQLEEPETNNPRPGKRPVETRASLTRGDRDSVLPRPDSQGDEQLSFHIERAATATDVRRDDLKKIRGITPGVEQALNRMGTYTYVQIAKWTADDIARVAQQLETPAHRIKRDNWIAAAKKEHREKYGKPI